ncbi:MAG: hypothetical protein KGO51_08115 [Alphaproteobacteria bacterium]|nr:hypothetical protein [Alphaproteobacteria bacterium]
MAAFVVSAIIWVWNSIQPSRKLQALPYCSVNAAYRLGQPYTALHEGVSGRATISLSASPSRIA